MLNDADIDKCGNLASVTDALGHVTRITRYSADGDPEEIIDPNGIVTTLTYDLLRHLRSLDVGGETTTYDYYRTGLLSRVTLPDGAYLDYTFDAARRLTEERDGLGNRIIYTLDLLGNPRNEEVYDPDGRLARSRTRVIDALNRLKQDIGANADRVTSYEYDPVGNLRHRHAPLNRSTTRNYDALNRLVSIIDPKNGTTDFVYDGQDALTEVIDATGQDTSYQVNGYGEVTEEISPDRGTTRYTYDAAGNLETRTDARNKTVTYGYDALNRLTEIDPGDGLRRLTWDSCPNGIGRLCTITDPSGTTQYRYDPLGRLEGKIQTIDPAVLTVGYAYNAEGNLAELTTPSGQRIGFTYANHRPVELTINGQPLLSGVLYEPFGPVRAWDWANGSPANRDFDLDGRMVTNDSLPTLPTALTWDAADRVAAITASDGAQTAYTYTETDELETVSSPSTDLLFTYDAVGNRMTKTDGTGDTRYTYDATSHRLLSEIGPVERDLESTFDYDNLGRLKAVKRSGATIAAYSYNALGQRVKKAGPATGGTRVFVYDEDGRLLGEYTESGGLVAEYVWLGDIPVAVLKPDGNTVAINYIHVDHLGTPRRVTLPDGSVIWSWDSAPFGETAADEDPDGDGVPYAFNLRFPGQYYDQETGFHYNYYRDYDPSTGRYIQSDPIGLAGGLNTYGYVRNNPLNRIDLFGLREFPDNFLGPLPPDGYHTSDMTNTRCGKVPPAPPGVDINKNMQQADDSWDPFWFYDQVRGHGPWDFKQRGRRYEDFGNYHYGATGAAFGFPSNILHRLAGWASQKADPTRKGLGSPWGRYPYGDDPNDQDQISNGIDYCECMGY